MTNIEKDNKTALSMLKISFLDQMPFKGSHKGMRYILKKEEVVKDNTDNQTENKNNKEYVLRVYTYKDLYNFENSKDIVSKDFVYDKDGINQALIYLDEKVKDYN